MLPNIFSLGNSNNNSLDKNAATVIGDPIEQSKRDQDEVLYITSFYCQDYVHFSYCLFKYQIREKRLSKLQKVSEAGSTTSASFAKQSVIKEPYADNVDVKNMKRSAAATASPSREPPITVPTILSSSPTKKNKDEIAVNSSLEQIFLFSLRSKPENNDNEMHFFNVQSDSERYLNSSNLSSYIFLHLNETIETGGAIGYLGNCYRRMMQKFNSASSDKVREELSK